MRFSFPLQTGHGRQRFKRTDTGKSFHPSLAFASLSRILSVSSVTHQRFLSAVWGNNIATYQKSPQFLPLWEGDLNGSPSLKVDVGVSVKPLTGRLLLRIMSLSRVEKQFRQTMSRVSTQRWIEVTLRSFLLSVCQGARLSCPFQGSSSILGIKLIWKLTVENQISFRMYGESTRMWRFQRIRQNEVYMSFYKKAGGSGTSKQRNVIHRNMKKSKWLVNMFAGPLRKKETWGTLTR